MFLLFLLEREATRSDGKVEEQKSFSDRWRRLHRFSFSR